MVHHSTLIFNKEHLKRVKSVDVAFHLFHQLMRRSQHLPLDAAQSCPRGLVFRSPTLEAGNRTAHALVRGWRLAGTTRCGDFPSVGAGSIVDSASSNARPGGTASPRPVFFPGNCHVFEVTPSAETGVRAARHAALTAFLKVTGAALEVLWASTHVQLLAHREMDSNETILTQ